MISNPFSLENKTILITGASSGIGQETAIQCSKLGAQLIITARDENRLNDTLSRVEGGPHKMLLADLTKEEDIARLVSSIELLEGLVLCAGRGFTTPFQFATREKYEDIFNINFYAPIELLRMLVKRKKMAKNSSIVFVSSVGGLCSFNVGNSVYGASKAAFNSVMKFCAKELAIRKIRVNSVNPGMVNTKLIQSGIISDEQHRKDLENYPLKRYGEPYDIACGIIYLLSDASSWVTGHSLIIDGGLTI